MKYLSSQKGFTLVEMIISLALFTVVAVIAIGALLRITDANKKSQTLKTAINNLNFALESMSREMRVGVNYAAGSSLINPNLSNNNVTRDTDYITSSLSASSDWYVAFNSSKTALLPSPSTKSCNLVFEYKYDKTDQTIKKAEQTNCLDTIFESDFYPVISPDVHITNSILRVDSDSVQPKAFFWFKGNTGIRARDKTEFELQTTVSQRLK